MRTAFLYGPGDIRVCETAIPEIGDSQALIKIKTCGICPSDVRLYTGERPVHTPINPGHEFAGEIIAIGPANCGFHVGDRVVTDLRVVCGECWYCQRKLYSYCPFLRNNAVYGGYCEYGFAETSSLRSIPESLSYEEASFAEPLACCLHGMNQCKVGPGSDVVVLGVGPIGLLHVQLAKSCGARVFACDTIDARLEKALEVGADRAIHVTQQDVLSVIREETGGRGAAAVIVTAATEAAARMALSLIGPCGTINFFAGFPSQTNIALDLNEIHYKQLTLLGSHNFTPETFTRGLQLLGDRVIHVATLITHRFPLDDIHEGFETVVGKTGLKVMIVMTSSH